MVLITPRRNKSIFSDSVHKKHGFGWKPDPPALNDTPYKPRLPRITSPIYECWDVTSGADARVGLLGSGSVSITINAGDTVKAKQPAGTIATPGSNVIVWWNGIALAPSITVNSQGYWELDTPISGVQSNLAGTVNTAYITINGTQSDNIIITVAQSPNFVGIDLRPVCPPVQDQGELDSCVANATGGAVDYLEIHDGIQTASNFTEYVSRLYIYYWARFIEGDPTIDNGCIIRDAITTLSQGNYGVPYESSWPYVDLPSNQFAVQPSAVAITEGQAHEIITYEKLDDPNAATMLSNIQDCLKSGYPAAVGITVYESFESPQALTTGIVPMPQSGEQILGGHAILLVGFNQTTQSFIFRNSWGISYGKAGYGEIPYAYICGGLTPDAPSLPLASDCWTISRGAGESLMTQ